jgi:hypothetical protein
VAVIGAAAITKCGSANNSKVAASRIIRNSEQELCGELPNK